eukprot:1160962-Pelagomonas_calceolata.AAC.11
MSFGHLSNAIKACEDAKLRMHLENGHLLVCSVVRSLLGNSTISPVSGILNFPRFPTFHEVMTLSTESLEPPLCKCGARTICFQVKKETANKGRWFYRCNLDRCDFFQWADKKPNLNSPQHFPGQAPCIEDAISAKPARQLSSGSYSRTGPPA